jgi:hypothetical protein
LGISGETERKVPIVRIKEIWATKTRRFRDSIKPGVRACGPKHTPSFRAQSKIPVLVSSIVVTFMFLTFAQGSFNHGDFSALQLICIMYAGITRIEPGMDIGVDLTQFISTSGWKTGMNALPATIRKY